jgi:hypothetical protein
MPDTFCQVKEDESQKAVVRILLQVPELMTQPSIVMKEIGHRNIPQVDSSPNHYRHLVRSEFPRGKLCDP